MAITDWPEAERPREKLLAHGAEVLSDAELLAVFLRVGVTGKSAVDLARDLLKAFGSLNGIFAATAHEISQIYGMGSSKYAQLQAMFEMSRRALAEQLKANDALNSSQQVRDYLCLKLGTLTQTSVYPREVVKRALHQNAASVIFAHNHPAGIAQQSRSDELLTKTLKQALALVDVRVLDRFIVAGNSILSFSERELI